MKKLKGVLVALVAMASMLTISSPASAADGGACAARSVCLYQWVGYGAQVAGNRWQSSLTNIYNHTNGCLTLGSATWANGTPVSANSAGIRITGDYSWDGWNIVLFDGNGCTGAVKHISLGGPYNVSDLHNISTSAGGNWYHRIRSFQIYYAGV